MTTKWIIRARARGLDAAMPISTCMRAWTRGWDTLDIDQVCPSWVRQRRRVDRVRRVQRGGKSGKVRSVWGAPPVVHVIPNRAAPSARRTVIICPYVILGALG